jgi:hypothetical protein
MDKVAKYLFLMDEQLNLQEYGVHTSFLHDHFKCDGMTVEQKINKIMDILQDTWDSMTEEEKKITDCSVAKMIVSRERKKE